jgi:hypothetical protein
LLAASLSDGQCVWHVYEDLGQPSLEHQADAEHVAVAVHLIALLHARFASHAVLAECRSCAAELRELVFAANVRDAVLALESLRGADAAP